MFLKQILKHGFKSVALIGLGKNTGKTFTFNQLVTEASKLRLDAAITTIGLDGDERDHLWYSPKPKIVVRAGQVVANAKTLLLASALDYEILAVTDIKTPLGEIAIARAHKSGKTILAGPGTGQDLKSLKIILEKLGIDFLFVDGAVDRRSLAAPLIVDTAVLAVGVEVAWDRSLLLKKLRERYKILTLPSYTGCVDRASLRDVADEVKAVIFKKDGSKELVSEHDFFQNTAVLAHYLKKRPHTIYIRGALTDSVLAKILSHRAQAGCLTLLAADPTNVFLGRKSWQKLLSQGLSLQVLDSIKISAVTVNPLHSRYGYADPLELLKDVGKEVHPVPCFDLSLGLHYMPEGRAGDGVF